MMYRGRKVSQLIPVGGEAYKIVFADGGIGYANAQALGAAKSAEERMPVMDAVLAREQGQVLRDEGVDRDAAREYLKEMSGAEMTEDEMLAINPMLKYLRD